jgi:predicted PurR-regulated permease PerM
MLEMPRIKIFVCSVIPRDLLAFTIDLFQKINMTFFKVIVGQVSIASVLGVVYITGFNIIGLSYATAIGAIAGVCRLIPYFDIVVALMLSFVIVVSDISSYGFSTIIGVLIVIVAAQLLDALFITPKIIGKAVGLHPGIVMASVVAFGYQWGFWGVLLAVPVVAVAKLLVTLWLPFYYGSECYDPKKIDNGGL